LIALDSNILVYAQQSEDEQGHHDQAFEIVSRASLRGAIVPVQVLGEFLNVCRSKLKVKPRDAIDQVGDYPACFDCPQTSPEDLVAAASLADSSRLQFFDALILTVAARAGATVLLSEDMLDGLRIAELHILNPFNPANQADINALLGQANRKSFSY
jgi:predicted nucleic acid-binding protein